MRTFLLKIAMLFSFLMSAAFGWLAVTMFFDLGLLNILMGIIALFFLFRALEFVDIINHLGPYQDEPEKEEETSGHKEEDTPEEGNPM